MGNLLKGKQMATFAVIEDEKVTNVIVADSKEIAEEVTGLTCVEYDQDGSNPAHIGYNYSNGAFTEPTLEISSDPVK